MTSDELHLLARRLLAGELAGDEFVREVAARGTADLGDVQLDVQRRERCGFPEVVFGEGKDVATLARIFRELIAAGMPVLATRVSAEKAAALAAEFPAANYHPRGRTFRLSAHLPAVEKVGRVAVVTAGTSDLPVAEEARETLEWMNVETVLVADVGVAGPQRLRQRLGELLTADAVVVVAGMEGALPSVVGGYVACPVIAVPTSVGYGASFGGVAPLLTMLNCCAANVVVVNIDAGFKAGYVAGLIARQKR